MNKPKCGHTIFDKGCSSCLKLKAKWDKKLKASGFKDIEYGLEHPERLYEPVPIKQLSDPNEFLGDLDRFPTSDTTQFYDGAWAIYHQWAADNRSPRDLVIAEMFAKQEDKTGTVRAIAAHLKSVKLKPYSKSSVHRTVKNIKNLILGLSKPGTTPSSE